MSCAKRTLYDHTCDFCGCVETTETKARPSGWMRAAAPVAWDLVENRSSPWDDEYLDTCTRCARKLVAAMSLIASRPSPAFGESMEHNDGLYAPDERFLSDDPLLRAQARDQVRDDLAALARP